MVWDIEACRIFLRVLCCGGRGDGCHDYEADEHVPVEEIKLQFKDQRRSE
jgi:hypothetical protein